MSAMNSSPGDSPDYEGLDLTSEASLPNLSSGSLNSSIAANAKTTSSSGASSKLNSSKPQTLRDVQVVFRCCKVHWRFPIPTEVLAGIKESWTVHCPRCGGELELP